MGSVRVAVGLGTPIRGRGRNGHATIICCASIVGSPGVLGMIDDRSPTGHRCTNCGAFCGVVYEYRGPSMSEVESYIVCGNNPPDCAHEDGTVSGCTNGATHEGSEAPNLIEKYWCMQHAPERAEELPYTECDDAE